MLGRTVREAAKRFGERPWMVAPDGAITTYAQLDAASDAVAATLRHKGIGPNDLVALRMGARPEYFIAHAALAKIGAITAGINTGLTDEEQRRVIERSAPDRVLQLDDVIRMQTGGPPMIRVLDLPRDPDRIVAVVFTSGTTGTPKGAVFCNRQLEFITEVDTGGRWGEPGPVATTRSLASTSFAHLGPMTKFAGTLMRGGTTYLVERWSAGLAIEMCERFGMAQLAGIPTQIALILRHPLCVSADLSGVRMVIMGGGPASPALIRATRDRFGVPVITRYACTEAGIGLGTGPTDDPSDSECSVGRPHNGVEFSLRNDHGVEVPVGEIGEVCLRSPAVMSGYWNDPDETEAALWPDGFVRTGDLGRVDEQGRLVLCGRSRDMYVRGGYNVWPSEAEAVLGGHPDVADLAIVARPDEVMGEIGVAVVVLAASASVTLEALRGFGAATLAHHKLPEALLVVDRLPLTAMDKLDRAALRRFVAIESV